MFAALFRRQLKRVEGPLYDRRLRLDLILMPSSRQIKMARENGQVLGCQRVWGATGNSNRCLRVGACGSGYAPQADRFALAVDQVVRASKRGPGAVGVRRRVGEGPAATARVVQQATDV